MADESCDDRIIHPGAQRYQASAAKVFEYRLECIDQDDGRADDKYQIMFSLRNDLVDEDAVDAGGGDAEKGRGQ